MPRKAPTEIVEHRITLGNVEREALKVYERTRKLETVSNAVPGVLLAAGVAGVGVGVYFAAQGLEAAWKEINGLITPILEPKDGKLKKQNQSWTDFVVFGPESVKTKDETFDPDGALQEGPLTGRDEEDPMRRKNPYYGVPGLSHLFGLGMFIGERTNPFD
tara:strand:- start:521 stop:1003 length:483 start_codon:yes stop_codon:yes gene_type:complete